MLNLFADSGVTVYRADYDANNNVIYEAWADPGTATSAAGWAILRHTYVGINRTVSEWCGGNQIRANVYDNRASLTYL